MQKVRQEIQPPEKQYSRVHLVRYVLLTILCLLLGLIDGFRSYVSAYNAGEFHVDFGVALRWDVSGWLVWILFIPLVFWLARRFTLNQNNWHLGVLVFLPTGLLIALARTLFPALVQALFFEGWNDLMQWLSNKFYVLITDYLIALVFYALVLTFGQAMNYYKRYREEELRTSQLGAQLAQAQLQALKAQLHPHFLFNALHSISSHLREPEIARRMIAQLGDFLRMTLANVGAQEVSLKQELEFLRCYLDIEQTRFRDRLAVDMEIDPETWDALLPNLILQPIVENAIKHGIAPQRAAGRISVRAQRLNGRLRVEIEDNGCGLPNALTPGAASEGASGDTRGRFNEGIGLGTTRSRLERFYPDSHLLQLRDAEEGGLVVTLEVPFKTEVNGRAS